MIRSVSLLLLQLLFFAGACNAQIVCPKNQPDTEILNTHNLEIIRYVKASKADVEEWKQSAIADDLIEENLISIPDLHCRMGEVQYPILDLMGWSHNARPGEYLPSVDRVAWTYSGLDPFSLEEKDWYEIKAHPPIRKEEKYEITDNSSGINLFHVNRSRAEQLLGERVPLPVVNVSKYFWKKVIDSSRPIIFTEGAKKAAALLSAGMIAVSVRGTCHAVEYSKENDSVHVALRKPLQVFLKQPRQISINFDKDQWDYSVAKVNASTAILGSLLDQQGAIVKVIVMPGPEKAADDLIMARGAHAFKELASAALTYNEWLAKPKKQLSLSEMYNIPWCSRPCNGKCAEFKPNKSG